MKTERITLLVVTTVLLLAALATVAPWLVPAVVDWPSAPELLLWATTALFTLTALAWAVLTYVVGILDPLEEFRVTEKVGGS